jgi:hypothetical protein
MNVHNMKNSSLKDLIKKNMTRDKEAKNYSQFNQQPCRKKF